jgi:hypothetical protein
VTQPSSGPSGRCQASGYAGATGGQRIQRAIDDPACETVWVASAGPDAGGAWLVRQPVRLRSNVALAGEAAAPPRIRAQNPAQTMVAVTDGRSNVAIRDLALEGAKLAATGILIAGSSGVRIERVSVSGMTALGVMIRDTPSSAITISESRFEDNGLIDVRTEIAGGAAWHSGVIVRSNSMRGSTYAVALANCGRDEATRCSVIGNLMKPKAEFPGTGVDLNRSHAALVSSNDILGAGDRCSAAPVACECIRGITVDDTQWSTIIANVIDGCEGEGIVLANGGVPDNRPWLVASNSVVNNTVRNSGLVGLASYRDPANPDDRNHSNVFRDNRLVGNARGGCGSNAPGQTFAGNGPQVCGPNPTAVRQRLRRPR